MQDVIFNGSGQRKPVARAAVELVFDNSLGRAAGQWSQYAELSVKRMLTRNGQSEYYINNLQVRRKDITDLFLGTGLGPRAYAIIGQGMISRIIEAKPDELRVFLEEAAGVTRYKERRKGNRGPHRRHAREFDPHRGHPRRAGCPDGAPGGAGRRGAPVPRVQQRTDEKAATAVAAEAQRGAGRARAHAARDVERATNDLEGQNAGLREIEAKLEAAREQHFGSSDGVHNAQSECSPPTPRWRGWKPNSATAARRSRISSSASSSSRPSSSSGRRSRRRRTATSAAGANLPGWPTNGPNRPR